MLFTGEYEHSIDSKHRLAVPAPIRSHMDAHEMAPGFFLVPMPDGSIWLWPEETFERLAGALEQSLVPGEDMQEFESVTFPLTRHATIDSAGRIRLPEDMLRDAGFGNNVMILGVRDHLELRDPAAWADQRKQKLARYGEIMLRAREAMRSQRDAPSGGK